MRPLDLRLRVNPRSGFPRSWAELLARFPDEQSALDYLAQCRGPHGLRCGLCGRRALPQAGAPRMLVCPRGHRLSLTAGTPMQRSRVPIRAWLLAAWLLATRPAGISATALQGKLGLSRYATALQMLRRLRQAMGALPTRPLRGEVEVALAPWSASSWVVVAVERAARGGIGAVRLGLRDEDEIEAWLSGALAADATVRRSGALALRVAEGLQAWLGHTHGGAVSEASLPEYLAEFAFRLNHRTRPWTAVHRMLGLARGDGAAPSTGGRHNPGGAGGWWGARPAAGQGYFATRMASKAETFSSHQAGGSAAKVRNPSS